MKTEILVIIFIFLIWLLLSSIFTHIMIWVLGGLFSINLADKFWYVFALIVILEYLLDRKR